MKKSKSIYSLFVYYYKLKYKSSIFSFREKKNTKNREKEQKKETTKERAQSSCDVLLMVRS